MERVQAATKSSIEAAFGAGSDLKIGWSAAGRPRSISRLGAALAAPEGSGAEDKSRSFLASFGPTLGLSAGETTALATTQVRSFGAVTQVRFQQVVAGLPVWGAQTAVTLNAAGEVLQLLAEDLTPGIGVDPRTTLSEQDAIAIALRAAGADLQESTESEAELVSQSGRWSLYRHPAAGPSDIPVQLVAFPLTAREGRPAYRIYVDGAENASYEMLIDGRTGRLLYSANIASDATARVYGESPLAGERELKELPEAWLPADATVMQGNRVDAFRDVNRDGEPDEVEIEGLLGGRPFSETGEFDFESGDGSTGMDPRRFPAAAAANVFYHANETLDAFYELGFTEVAGNFQTDNFGRGGEGDDALLATVHGGFGAFYTPRPDGIPGRITMGLESNGTFTGSDDYDTSYIRQIIVHEIAHGLTGRLIGGPDRTDCLSARIADGLSEGWSDYYATSFTDNPEFGFYSVFATPGSGIRRQSYEGHTLQHQDIANEGFQVHRDGEIWAATLWDVRKQLGREVTDILVTDALPLTPCNPSMVDAKDAILIVDAARFEGANRAMLREIFARHGLGFSSSSLDGFRLVESVTWNAAFDLPPVEGANRNPIVTGRIPDTYGLGEEMAVPLPVEDPDGDTLTFEVLDGPPGLRVDEAGMLHWSVNRFGPKRVLIDITDGNGGRILHGFTTPVLTTFQPGEEILISGESSDLGLFRFNLDGETPLMRVRLRGGETAGDADLTVFPPAPPSVTSFRFGTSNEALSFPDPGLGVWTIRVNAFTDLADVGVEAVFPEIPELTPGELIGPLSGGESDESFFSFTVPEGVESATVSMGGGSGHADLLVARDRLPICQFGSVSQNCDYDEFSTNPGSNNQLLTIVGPEEPEALTAEGGALAVAPGRYFANVVAHDNYAEASLLLTLDTGQPAPRISRFGIVHGATFGFITAPGSIASAFGENLAAETVSASTTPLPRSLAGVELLVNGEPAPLYFVSPEQINFQMPFEVEAFSEPSVMVRRDGMLSPFDSAFVIDNAPEVFQYSPTPDSLSAVIVHADFSLVTAENPARSDELLTVFLTGFGELDNAPATGEAAAAEPLATLRRTLVAELAGQEIPVTFAGLTPGFVGLGQVNIQATSAPLNAVTTRPLVFRVGGYETISVLLWLGP